MKKINYIMTIILVLITVFSFAMTIQAQEYPSRTIEVIAGWGAGGGTDIFSRDITVPMSKILGVNMPVVNMPGASSAVAMDYVQKQPADGYTLFAITSDIMVNSVVGISPYSYEDIAPVVRGHVDVGMIQVGEKSPFQDWNGLVEYAQENPKLLTIGGTGAASFDEVATMAIMQEAGIKVSYVPFDSASIMHSALVGGHIMAIYEELGPAKGLIEAGNVIPVLVIAPERLEALPDVPCAAEFGYNLPPMQWRGLCVKAGTPEEIVNKLAEAAVEAINSESHQKFMHGRALDLYPGLLVGEEFKKDMERESEIYTRILKDLGYVE
ncbi:MAG: Bug family tripartite tricarboxylate transporter substrate binding protein [Candidatus Helarchaeota archaeon]